MNANYSRPSGPRRPESRPYRGSRPFSPSSRPATPGGAPSQTSPYRGSRPSAPDTRYGSSPYRSSRPATSGAQPRPYHASRPTFRRDNRFRTTPPVPHTERLAMPPVASTTPVTNFKDLNLSPKILAVLEGQKFVTPTPIQHQCIPLALEGKDIVGIAQTGTGKTLAFGLPSIQRILEHQGQALILLPTRELATQAEEMLQKIGRTLGLKIAVLIGGTSSHEQRRMLARNPHIVISTPGRLNDHLQHRNYSLCQVKILVLDEADRMLDIGFLPQIKAILEGAPKERQTMMFSATMPGAIAEIAAKYMKIPLRIEVAPTGTASSNVEQEIFIIDKEAKMQLLEKFLSDNTFQTVLVFSRTKHFAKKIAGTVRAMGHSAAEIHSNRSMGQRKEALDGFKSGKYRVLVATDIASRGIDVNNISLVINYDLPDALEDYVHRIGRTGRAGKFGKAVSFATPAERYTIRQLERLIRKTIPVLALPPLPQKRTVVVEATPEPRRFGRSRGPSGAPKANTFRRRFR